MELEAVEIFLSPSGQLHTEKDFSGDQDDLPTSDLGTRLQGQFRQSSTAGLVFLASSVCKDQSLAPTCVYWRQFALRYFDCLRRHAKQIPDAWQSPVLRTDDVDELRETAPPMRGIEYLTNDTLLHLWQSLDEFVRHAVQQSTSGLGEYLYSLDPAWNLVGRVTFHLAENKRDEQYPFAFMATFTEAHATGKSLRHIPLGEALKQSAVDRDTDKLTILLEPVQRAAQSSELVRSLLNSRKLFSPQAWTIAEAYQFLRQIPVLEEAGIIVRVPNWWTPTRPPRPQVQVRIGEVAGGVASGIDVLDFDVNLVLDGQSLTQEEIQRLINARQGLTLLRGKWVEIDGEKLKEALSYWRDLKREHMHGISFLEGLRLMSGVSEQARDETETVRNWSRIEPGQWLLDTLHSLRDPSRIVQIEPGQRLRASLRHYQDEGVRWMWFLTKLGLGACLADDMGLGKTIQVLALLLQMQASDKQQKVGRPSLLIVPASLLGNWKREAEKFAPDLRLCIAHRSQMDSDQFARLATSPGQELAKFDLVATTYGMIRRESWLNQLKWRLIVLDEAQAIKNAGAAQTKAIKNLAGDGRIALTGTPVENHLGDLWSLFDFCSPGLLGTTAQFKKYVKASTHEKGTRNLTALRKLVRPYILRRLKTDPHVAPDLPSKTEMRVDCGLSAVQAELYRQIIVELSQALDSATGIRRQGVVLGALMQLKQICNHPSLYLKRDEFKDSESGKYDELQAICETISQRQEKVIVFTQFQSMCEPLSNFLGTVFGRPGLILTGKTSAKKRSELVQQFQAEMGPPFFVISVKAGGTGLNLTQACHVVHFDRWWNPAVEDQATDRAFRIGQTRNVLVHKFVCRGTVEEKIHGMIQEKRSLSRELFGEDDQLKITEMSDEQLLSFVALDINKATGT